VKGATSGDWQELLAVDLDCDRDALRFTVRQHGAGHCHLGCRSCWGDDRGLPRLARRLAALRAADGVDAASNSARLLREPPLLAAKLREEAAELAAADADVVAEAADVLFFTMLRLAAAGVDLAAVEAELDRRERRVTRRPCASKEDGA
jgi:phosphoribosyl-ATP pyrophosphohydrolase